MNKEDEQKLIAYCDECQYHRCPKCGHETPRNTAGLEVMLVLIFFEILVVLVFLSQHLK